MAVTYYGKTNGVCDWIVYARNEHGVRYSIPVRLDLANHSPDGFAWGYGGSGPAQLALALCAHATGDDDKARAVYQRFKSIVIANLPQHQSWSMTQQEVLDHIAAL
jgi:hypothetical protein